MADLKQYVADAIRTECTIERVRTDTAILLHTIHIMIAAGRILDQIKKNVFYGKEIDGTKFQEYLDSLISHIGWLEDEHSFGRPVIEAVNDLNPRIFHSIIGIATEATELLEALIKPDLDGVNILEEFGDINWYQALGIDALEGDFDQILETNIKKLKARYPEKFTSDCAINRDLEAERIILETQKQNS